MVLADLTDIAVAIDILSVGKCKAEPSIVAG